MKTFTENVVDIRLSCQIMESAIGLVINFVGAASGVADKSNPPVAVSVTGGAAEGGGLVRVKRLLTLLLRCLLSSSSLFRLSSPVLTPFRTAVRHALWSSAFCSQLPGSMSANLRSRLQASLEHSAGWPAGRCPVASSPYSTSFGMRPSPMRSTWPSHR